MDIDLKLMIFGIQLSLLGGFIVMLTAPFFQEYVGEIGFLLIIVGTFLGLIGLMVRAKPQKPI
jgi:hypothetical protein